MVGFEFTTPVYIIIIRKNGTNQICKKMKVDDGNYKKRNVTYQIWY